MKKALLLFLLSIPLLFLGLQFYFENVTDPIKYIYTITGFTAIILLFFTTTISLIKSKLNLMAYRKIVGLSSFFYAFLHFINFIVLDMELDPIFALEETLDKPFIYLGMIAFILTLFMAITSTKNLFKKYHKYHRVIYISLTLTTIHFVMAQKALSEIQWFFLGVIAVITVLKVRQLQKLTSRS